jgi:hypothetical protein
MGLFSAIVGVAIETVKLPLSIAKDVFMVVPTGGDTHETHQNLERIKREAEKAQ